MLETEKDEIEHIEQITKELRDSFISSYSFLPHPKIYYVKLVHIKCIMLNKYV